MKISIVSNSGEFTFDCPPDEKILHAGLRKGMTLPYECASGTCGTCRARIVEGEVDIPWNEAPGFARLKREKGDILMCLAQPRRDCVLQVPAQIAAHADLSQSPALRRGAIQNPRTLARDVIEFDVALSQPMTFLAGQFVLIRLPELEGGRAYSMVNYQPDASHITLVVKRKHGGGFCEWLFGRDVHGQPIDVFGPLGRATLRLEEDKNILCIAGGSGIAGMMAILERAARADYFADHRGDVFFGVRTMIDSFYLRQFADYVAASHGNLAVTLALSDEAAAAARHEDYPAVQLASGLVHEVAGHAMAGRYNNLIAFLAGPTPMVNGAIKMLVSQGKMSTKSIRYDKFT